MTEGNGDVRELPKAWCFASIEDSLIPIRGISFPKDAKQFKFSQGLIACLRTANIQEKVEWKDIWFVDESYVGREEQVIEEGDILISVSNSLHLLGKVAIVNQLPFKTTLGTFIANLRVPKDLNKNFIYYYLSSHKFRSDVRERASTTTNISNISIGKLEKIRLVIAPASEQKRIVEKIEELCSDLDQGVESLKAAQKQLKVYRQAVLKWAFEGKLTEVWRTQHQSTLKTGEALLAEIKAERENRYRQQLAEWETAVKEWEAIGKVGKKPTKPQKLKEVLPLTESEIAELPEIPSSWHWVFPEDIAAIDNYSLGIGPFGSNLKVSDYTTRGMPLIFVRHITSGNFDLDSKYVSQEKFEELLPHSVKSLDLLITKMGDPPGDCEIYPQGRKEGIITSDCLKFRVWDDFVNRKFYKYCTNSNLNELPRRKRTGYQNQKRASCSSLCNLR